ncbi:MAG: hypothetical protein ACYC1P_05405 [Gaiellaceae bacterium]
MKLEDSDLLSAFSMPARRHALRRKHLLRMLDREAGRADSVHRLSRNRRSAAVVVAGAVFVVASVGTAVTGSDFLREQERVDALIWTPPAHERDGERLEVARGGDWSLMAWPTSAGACVAYAAGSAGNWVRACGTLQVGEEDAPRPEHLITLGYVPSSATDVVDGKGAIFGALRSGVAHVEVEVRDGRVLAAQALTTGSANGTRYFIVRASLPEPQGVPITSVSLFDDDGKRLEEFVYPGS